MKWYLRLLWLIKYNDTFQNHIFSYFSHVFIKDLLCIWSEALCYFSAISSTFSKCVTLCIFLNIINEILCSKNTQERFCGLINWYIGIKSLGGVKKRRIFTLHLHPWLPPKIVRRVKAGTVPRIMSSDGRNRTSNLNKCLVLDGTENGGEITFSFTRVQFLKQLCKNLNSFSTDQ